MAQYNLTREEQETTINWYSSQKTVKVDTADPVMIRRFDKLVEAYPEEYKLISEDSFYEAKRYQMPLKRLGFKKPPSKAQTEARRKAGLKARKNLLSYGAVLTCPPILVPVRELVEI